MKKLILLAILPLMVSITACPPPPALAGQSGDGIAAASDRWELAFQAGDVAGILAMYSDDARILPPNEKLGQGHDAVGAVFKSMFDAGLTGELTTIEAKASGDLGYNLGTYRLWTKADKTEVDRGKFIEVWRKTDGEWKIVNDIFNSDLPCAAKAHDHP